TAPGSSRVQDGLLHAVDKIGGGQKQAEKQHRAWQIGERKSGAGEKNQRQPQKLVPHHGVLQGVGHAGNHQTERAKREDAHRNQDEKREGIAETRNVEDDAREEQFKKDSGQGEHVVGDNTGSQQVAGSHRSHVEAPKNSLFTKQNEGGTESPETAHDVESHDRAEIKADRLGRALAMQNVPAVNLAGIRDAVQLMQAAVRSGPSEAHFDASGVC